MTMETTHHRAKELVQKGKEALNNHHLSEAERLFLGALHCLPNDTTGNNTEAYEAYHGLAQTYTKKGRYSRNDEKEWHRYYLQSLAMYKQAVRVAPTEDDEAKVKEELAPVQEIYCQCLETRLFPPPPPNRSNVRRTEPKSPPKMNAQWLQQLKEHIQTKLASTTDQSSRVSVSSEGSSIQEDPIPPQREEHSRKKVDFNRVRKTIMRMVKQISTDMRSKYMRKHLSQDTLKQAVSSKMLCMLTPENENMDVVSLFESFIVDEEEYNDPADAESCQKHSSTESECEENVTHEVPRHVITPLCSIRESYAVPRTYHHVTSPRRGYRESDSNVKLNGILRVWRGYNETNLSRTAQFAPHKLNFEECSPLTETSKYSFQDIQARTDDTEVASEHKILTTFAGLLSNIADKLSSNNQYSPADELYTYALGLYQQYEAYIPVEEGSNIAHLLNSMGKLRCRKGDMIGGTHLMEQSVDMYRRFHGQDEHVDIISVWYELGQAFLYEQCHDDSLFDHVMKTVKSRVVQSKEGTDQAEVDYDSDDSDESGEDSYLLHIHEAKGCFSHALRMLHNLRKNKHEMHNSIYIEVLSKLADCCVMLGDYQKATLCYEEALILFQNIIGSSLLSLNAHVLTMLGVTNFMLGNYPKAVGMLETSHILQQHMDKSEVTFDKAFTLTMLGITNHKAGHYYKCVAWCLKAHEMYVVLFPDLTKLTALKCWFVIQNVYMLGYAYSFLNLQEQALQYLELSSNMALSTLHDDDASHTTQVVHILKLIADAYVAMDQSQGALEHYEKAHEYSVKLGEDQRSNTLHNQLLNCMAGLHITSKNYNTAAECLEQALDYQENLQDSIKGDMFEMLHSLGLTYTFSGDIDKAIDCYKEAIEAYHEMHEERSQGPEIAGLLGRLATLYHVKMCLEEDESEVLDLCELAEKYYQEAIHLDPQSPLVVQFANFQYQQSQTPDALLGMLPFLQRSSNPSSSDVIYNGPEQAVLPTHLQFDVDEVDEVILNAKVFGHFLAILCFKELNLFKDAEDSLVELYKLVYQTSVAINFSMLGYALMEMDLLEEAAEVFGIAVSLDPETTNSLVNVWLCSVTLAYRVLSSASAALLEHACPLYDDVYVYASSDVGKSHAKSDASKTDPVYASTTATTSHQSAVSAGQGTSPCITVSQSGTTDFDQNYNLSFEETQQRNDQLTVERINQEDTNSERQRFSNIHQKQESFVPRSRYSPVVPMDISPVEPINVTIATQWQDADDDQGGDSHTDALDELLKSSEEIEAELQDCLQHIDAVQDKGGALTDWRTGDSISSPGWQTSQDSIYSSDWRNRLSRDSSDWRKSSDSGCEVDWRTGKDLGSSDWRTGKDSSSSDWRNAKESGSYDWRKTSESQTPKQADSAPPATGWRAATSSRTQEILMSIQNNNMTSREKTPDVERVKDEPREEEEWQVWEEEEVIETPPELLAAILNAQKQTA